MKRYKLTKRFVDGLEPADRETSYPDQELEGFGLRVRRSGAMSYTVRYRDAGGRLRRHTLGRHPDLTPIEARRAAREVLGRVRQPHFGSQNSCTPIATVRDLAERYNEDYGRHHKAATTVKADLNSQRKYILPALGGLRLDALSRGVVARWHRSVTGRSAVMANRALNLLKAMLNWADREELAPPGIGSCCRFIKRNPERPRERFLNREELQRLGAVLHEEEEKGRHHPSIFLVVRLLLLTGCRRDEIRTLRWQEVDFDHCCLRLDTKTGPAVVPLGADALKLLENAPRLEGNPYVCFGREEGQPISTFYRVWRKLREAAGLRDVRIHDLRHSFASVGAGQGLSLPMIGQLLCHRQTRTTERYAHLARSDVQQAANQVAAQIADRLNSQTGLG
jgi:integrase